MTPEIKRRQDESLKDYKVRICSNKDVFNLTWEDIKDIFNEETGDNWGESVYRKWWASFSEGMDYEKKNAISSDEVLNEYELKKIELEKERKKLQSIRIDYNRMTREESRKELLFEHVKEAIEKLPTPEFNPVSYPNGEADKVGVLSFADIHFSKVFESLNNRYSEDIAKERMEELIAEVLPIIEQHSFDHIHIINGADSIEGMSLRISQLQSLQTGFIDQTIKFSKFIASWLNELSKYVKISYHHIPSSNHSEIRPFNSKRGEFPAEDLEKIIMNYVHDVLEDNDRIEVPLYESGLVKLKLLDYNVWAIHGHQLKGRKNAIRDLSLLHREFVDILYVAHFHHAASITVGEGETNNMEIIQIPSIMGSDEYSDSLMTGAKAGANFSVYEKGKGRTISYNIILN